MIDDRLVWGIFPREISVHVSSANKLVNTLLMTFDRPVLWQYSLAFSVRSRALPIS